MATSGPAMNAKRRGRTKRNTANSSGSDVQSSVVQSLSWCHHRVVSGRNSPRALRLVLPVNYGSDGRFAFNNVTPGNYKLFAWEEIQTGSQRIQTLFASLRIVANLSS